MSIAKPEWFARRKYTGWGLFPKTWQGVLYIIVIAAITIGLVNLPIEMSYRIGILIVWAILAIVDMGGAMIGIKDEREKRHEAIAERNALWAVLIVLIIGVSYQISAASAKQNFSGVDWFLVAAVVVALIVKAISNIWLERKN